MLNEDFMNDLDDLENSSENNEMGEQEMNEEIFVCEQSQLLKSDGFLTHMKNITQLIDSKIQTGIIDTKDKKEDIELSNKYALEIDREVEAITKFVKEIYDKKMPSLKGIVPQHSLYCRTIVDIEQKNNDEEKFNYLNPQQRISVRLEVSTPSQALTHEEKQKALKAAQTVLILQQHHDELMAYLQTSMKIIAPNLCQLLGSFFASKLISAAGGIDRLAAMPACNIQVMGGTRSAEIGLSQLQRNHTGIFGQMQVVKDAPKKFQMKLIRMLATNTAKCARADYLGTDKTLGHRLYQDLLQRFEKVQEEGGLMRVQKPMEIPDMLPKKKRGGKRHRKMKELYERSQMRKLQNRIQFGEAEEQIDEGVGLGMLKSGVGKLNIGIKKQNLKTSKKMKQRMEKKSGLESSVNLAASQGIELINPALKQETKKQSGIDSYFNRSAGFRTIINEKLIKK